MLDRRQFIWTFLGSITAGGELLYGSTQTPRRPAGRASAFPVGSERIGCLYNGYFLTVDPGRALATVPSDRHRLYVLHAVLIDPSTGRIAATYPALPSAAQAGDPVARAADQLPALYDQEQPPAPGITAQQVAQYWHNRNVDPSLLQNIWLVDLRGAVATPGLIDTHFHVSSWSKKLPDEGQRFGFYADIGDPSYYTDVSNWGRLCVHDAMWHIVADANVHLAEQDQKQIYLHGYWFSTASEQEADGYPRAFLFTQGTHPPEPDPAYLLNRVSGDSAAPRVAPSDPCGSDPSTWPAVDYDAAPALLVHTSGQMCWYNSAVLRDFNQAQSELASAFPETAVVSASPPSGEGEIWEISLDPAAAGTPAILDLGSSFTIDLVAPPASGQAARHVPFYVETVQAATSTLRARAILAPVADEVLGDTPPEGLTVVPFSRPIPLAIADSAWREAAEAWGEDPESERVGYGHWDPARPYETNWYNGAERGLIQYVRDEVRGEWRPSGYAEHYVMRDRLASLVHEPLTATEGMRHRRNLVRWCHRHGITSIHDIMFYRRGYATAEFAACEGLSYDHQFKGGRDYYRERGVDTSEPTGDLNLRVGLYYYIENAAGIDEVVGLAHAADQRTDPERLQPPEGHPEYPGWVRWLGWKLQLDGGTGARTLFTSAPMPKPAVDDPVQIEDETGRQITLFNHGFGLLTMTNHQEQIFTSRESAALYWLVRESDPSSQFYNQSMTGDWSFLARGVVEWMDRSVDMSALTTDMGRLQRVSGVSATQLADKIGRLQAQVQSGWERTLMALVRIWYEASIRRHGNVPMPRQVVCHNIGDGAVDLYTRALKRLRDDLRSLPAQWSELPSYWQAVIPENADLSAVRRTFDGERYRIEHLLNVSGSFFEDLHGADGLDASTDPTHRNVVLSTQPALLVLDGQAIRNRAFPYAQEMWPIADDGSGQLWAGIPANPRCHHHMPCPLFRDHDIPYCLSSDPPAVRDPRPAVTLIGAVARTPVEIDPSHWVGEEPGKEPERPIDYLVGKVYGPLGLTPTTPDNPMFVSLEEAFCAMTFWAAHIGGLELETGALAPAGALAESEGWFADLVVWGVNPLAIRGPEGMRLEDLATTPEGSDDVKAVQMANAFIRKLQPTLTVVGGVPVYAVG